MAKITLFEIHPKGTVQLGSGSQGRQLLDVGTGTDDGDGEEAADDESGGGLGRILVPLLALIVIAAAVRFLGGGSDDVEEGEFEDEEGRLSRFKTTTE